MRSTPTATCASARATACSPPRTCSTRTTTPPSSCSRDPAGADADAARTPSGRARRGPCAIEST